MPFLSVIIPVYGVQGYLRECLDSVLDQRFDDFEVIAIDDNSPDHCGRILDEYAERDPRMRVVHLDHNIGNGHARNLGLARAAGEYVWFVDSDDRLATGAIPAVVEALRRSDPQVLLVDHVRVSALGEFAHQGARGPRGEITATTVVEEPRLLKAFTVAWNKILRRDFLLRTGVRFDTGWYEDIPFTYPVLIAAERVATLRRVCYHYRRRRTDAITSTRSTRHFEVFDQWSLVFDRLDQMAQWPDGVASDEAASDEAASDGAASDEAAGPHGEPPAETPGTAGTAGAAKRAAAVRDEIFHRMVWHLLVVLSMPDRLPAGSRRAFFRQLSAHYHRYRPAGYGAPTRLMERLRHRLIAADAYRAFRHLRALRLLARVGRRTARVSTRRLRSIAGAVVRRIRAGVGITLYHLTRLRPVDENLAVYAAYWYRGYACNPAAIYEKAKELVPHVRGVWVVDRRHVDTMPPGVSYVVDGSMRYYRALARARWLVNNVNFPDFVVKRAGTTFLQTHHGTPVKVMGLEQHRFPVAAADTDMTRLLRRSDRWDYSITSNAHSTEVWSRAYPCRYQTLEHGYPRNDRLARATAPDGSADVADTRHRLGLPDDATVVLYAPTHREYLTGFQPLLDVEEFARAVGPDVVVLQRAHYFYGSRAVPTEAERADPSHAEIRDVSRYPVVEDLMLAADVLVTDYSSVMFDYAVLDRPVAIFAPDWDSYVRLRGVTFDLLAQPPGVVATNQSELVDAFRTGQVWGDEAAQARHRFRDRFSYLDDGNASERVVRQVFATELNPEPERELVPVP